MVELNLHQHPPAPASRLAPEISGLPIRGQEPWRKWWKSVSENGERATLTSMISTAEHANLAAAKRLLERYPQSLVDVIRIASQRECPLIKTSEHAE